MISYSFIIPTVGTKPSLGSALRALSSLAVEAGRVEAIVVFDGFDRKWSEARLKACAPGLKITALEQPRSGPACARNLGASLAVGDWVIFIDDDCELEPSFLDELERGFERNPKAAFSGTALLPASSSVWSVASQMIIEAFIESQRMRDGGLRFLPTQCLAVPRSTWEETHGFNEAFTLAAGEDREFCLRWINSGRSLVRLPRALYVHNHPLNVAEFLAKHAEYGRASRRVGSRRDRAPLRFVRSLSLLLLKMRPFGRIVPVATALFLSQIANAWGASQKQSARKAA
jgi:GT2 family glycosyltransferase